MFVTIFTKNQKAYNTVLYELPAVVWSIFLLKLYFEEARFIVRADCNLLW